MQQQKMIFLNLTLVLLILIWYVFVPRVGIVHNAYLNVRKILKMKKIIKRDNFIFLFFIPISACAMKGLSNTLGVLCFHFAEAKPMSGPKNR